MDNLVDGIPFAVWANDTMIDAIDISDDGDSIASDFMFDGSCDWSKGSNGKLETNYRYRVCAQCIARAARITILNHLL